MRGRLSGSLTILRGEVLAVTMVSGMSAAKRQNKATTRQVRVGRAGADGRSSAEGRVGASEGYGWRMVASCEVATTKAEEDGEGRRLPPEVAARSSVSCPSPRR